jgi:S1-C subfamily serine protease
MDNVVGKRVHVEKVGLIWLLPALGIARLLLLGRNWPAQSGLNPRAQLIPVTARGALSGLEETNIAIYDSASPTLVQITNLTQQRSDWFSLDLQEVPAGIGSGFVWDRDGHIVTNYHVVDGANAAQVTLSDHSTYRATRIWAYEDQDIAVLAIDAPASKLHPIQLGTSRDLKVGQVVYALGDPFGLGQTMTNGIVSALGRTFESANGRPITAVIQTSAAVNPGNSGGPLLDSAGRLVGMTTAIVSPSGAFVGVSFAIPVDPINRIVTELIQHGKVVRPRLGVQVAESSLAEQLGVDRGALITKVIPNSGADRAALRRTGRDTEGNIRLGDVIIEVDGKTVGSSDDLYTALQDHKVGDTVALTVIRDDKQQHIQVTLDEGNGGDL